MIYLVLLIFMLSLFRANHSLMRVSSKLIFSLSNLQSGAPAFCLKVLTVQTSVVSSAYSIALNLSLAICKSLIYSMNSNGPNIDP